jgi:hypothetical protein
MVHIALPISIIGAWLSVAVHHEEPLLIIQSIISSSLGDQLLLIIWLSATVQNCDPPLVMGCIINNGLFCELLLIRLFYSGP